MVVGQAAGNAAAGAAGGNIPEVPVVGHEESNMITMGWTAVILVFLFYFFNIGELLSSLFTSAKRKMARPEAPEKKVERENTMREARLKQQELFDQLSAEAKEKGLVRNRKISSKEKRIKNSTAYKMSDKKKKKVYKFDDDNSGNYRPSPSSRRSDGYGGRGGRGG